jgi:hypothetical protein
LGVALWNFDSKLEELGIFRRNFAEKNEANFRQRLTFQSNLLILFLNFREETHA